jgi:solute carrier family 45 protein 1/2/4
LDLPAMVDAQGEFAQMRLLCLLGIIVLWASCGLTLVCIREEPQSHFDQSRLDPTESGLVYLFRTIRRLPTAMQNLFETQFFNWLGWFPFLFYSSSWLLATPHNQSSQIGSRGLFFFSLVSLITSLVLPFIQHRFNFQLSKLWSLSLFFSFLVIQLSMFYPSSTTLITLTVASMGIPWFATGWIPFALISLELTRKNVDDEDLQVVDIDARNPVPDSPHSYTLLQDESVSVVERNNMFGSGMILGIHNIYICVPQLVSSLLTSLVFNVVDASGPETLGWVIRVGSVFTLIAALKAWKL